MENVKHEILKKRALSAREQVIRMATDGGCFLGASLSCIDLIVYLYSEFLKIDMNTIDSIERDYFFLSKGHDVPALYATLSDLGFFEKQRLLNHLKTNDYIYWHPNKMIPGVEFHSGSLGHLISVAIGVALDIKIRLMNNKVVVLLGDGELNEGSVWEALLVANAYKLDNLLLVIDRNQFQANMKTESLIPLEPLESKFEAFGLEVYSIDGHNFQEIDETFQGLSFNSKRPTVIIADTIRGKGLPSIEEKADRWFCNFSHKEIENLIDELYGKTLKTELTSEKLIVR
ncbi:MAG: 1-deoxy-D-xylulose-5-phosphate synthase N-terminal domain-containing protein [Bacteroidota bacterium]|nr:1-deoxy-D-xylulose-5-phosphate synthase N-terminal domain-containing protein [Bacteroidota bacterium]MDP4191259.1 1-deoxy-D-xylulose-5-phosphate synthase N-terminal domain-containing protein [Bacteroidota bacterium]MDP4194130.1 1-deoxy-D-xylulose-5-phosphate synthase N-terminal domain-containing protein [Bacteroidota bacterium]